MTPPPFGEARHETPYATRVLAPNPSPMTLDGTNTWILGAPGGSVGAVVDPGPDDEGHLRDVAGAAAARGLGVAVVLITHHHADHTEGAARFAQMVGAPIRSVERGTLAAGDVIALGEATVEVLGTPGHTADSVSFLLPQDGSLLTGDTVLGRGTTVVAWPDGRLGDYLDSLTLLRETVDGGVRVILPAHGDPVTDPAGVLDAYLAHRRERLAQVEAALVDLEGGAGADDGVDDGADDGGEAGAADALEALVEGVVQRVYAQVPREVWPAARLSVRAQIEYLRQGDGRG